MPLVRVTRQRGVNGGGKIHDRSAKTSSHLKACSALI